MKNIFRKLKKPARYTALAVVILFGLTYIYLRFIVRDIPKFDDSRMELKYSPVPVQDNAFPMLVMAEVPFNDPLYESLLNELKTIEEELKKSNGRMTPRTEKLVKLHFMEKIALLERAGDMKYSQTVDVEHLKDQDPWNRKIPNYLSLRTLAQIRLAMARKDFENGRAEQAVHGALAMLKAGSIIQHGDGGSTLISIMIGVSIKQSSLTALNEFFSSEYIPDGDSRNVIISTLNAARESQKPWENAWKGEYHVCSSVLQEWEAGRINLAEDLMNPKSGTESFVENIILGIILKPEKARRICFDFFSRQIRNSMAGSYADVDLTKPKLLSSSVFTISNALNGDLGAALFTSVLTPNFVAAVQKKSLADFLVNATILRIGLLSYHKKAGQFPDKLGALLPEFIPEIPKDPFDGKPIRYDKNCQIIYSVGLNLKDDGGNVQGKFNSPFVEKWSETRNRKDIVVKLLR